MTTTTCQPAGPLTTAVDLPDDLLLQHNARAAEVVAFRLLSGRLAVPNYTHRQRPWMRWTGASWRECDRADVNAAVRRALTDAHARMLASGRYDPDELARLLDLNWQLGPLTYALRVVVTVPPHRLTGSGAELEASA